MVKYLSDQRNDPYYQTKLSLSQPFEAEVPQKMYPVDEVDLSPALDMIESGARAYYAHQGEELQRENMAISYSTYQANRAEAQSKAQKDNAEKQLVNTMKNDLYGKLNRIAEFASQGGDPSIVDRLTRETVMQQLKYSGAYLNADDATKVAKDLGLNITGDLLRNRINLEAEAQKQAAKDYHDTIEGNANFYLSKDFAATLTFKQKEDFYINDAIANQNFVNSNSIDANEENAQDIPTNTTYVSTRTKQNAVEYARNLFKNALLERMTTIPGDFRPTQEDIDAELNNVAAMLVNESGGRIDTGTALRLAQRGATLSGYIPASNLRSAQIAAMAKDTTNLLTIEKAPAERVNARNAYAKALITQQLMQNTPVSLFISNPELGKALYEENADYAQALDNALANLNFTGKTTGVDVGTKFVEIIDDSLENPENAPASYTMANAVRRWAASAFAEGDKYTYWDRAAALTASQNSLTVLNGGEGPNTPGARIKADNGEQNTDWYRQFVESGEMKYLPQEKRDQLFKDVYQKNRDRNTVLYMNDILGRDNPFRNNIRFDKNSNKLVAVNVQDLAAYERAGQLKLYKELDKINQYFNDGKYSEFRGKETAEEYKNAVLELYNIQDVAEGDVVHQRSSVYNLMEALVTGDTAEAYKETPGAVADVVTGTLETLKEGSEYIVGKNVENYLDLKEQTKDMSKEEQHDALTSAFADAQNKTMNFLASLRGEPTNQQPTRGQEIARLERETKEALDRQEKSKQAVETFNDMYNGNIDVSEIVLSEDPSNPVKYSIEKIGGNYALIPLNKNGKELSKVQAMRVYNETGEGFGVYDSKEEAQTVADAINVLGEGMKEVRNTEANMIKSSTGVTYTGNISQPLEVTAQAVNYDSDIAALEGNFQFIRHNGKYFLEAIPGGTDKEAKEYLKNTGNYLGVSNTKEGIEKQAEALMDATWGNRKEQGEDKAKVQGFVSVFDAQGNQIGRTAAKDISTGEIVQLDSEETSQSSYSEVQSQSNSTQRRTLSSTVTDHSIPEDVMKEIPSVADALNVKEVDILDKLAAESSMGKQAGTSKAGAKGLMQVTNVAKEEVLKDKEIMKDIKEAYPNFKGNISDPLDNIILGAGYIKYCEKMVDKKCASNGVRLSQKDKNDLVRVVYNHGTGSGLNKIIDTIKEHPKDWKDRKPFSNYKNYLAMQDYKRFVK